jgi:hypothetical protein
MVINGKKVKKRGYKNIFLWWKKMVAFFIFERWNTKNGKKW